MQSPEFGTPWRTGDVECPSGTYSRPSVHEPSENFLPFERENRMTTTSDRIRVSRSDHPANHEEVFVYECQVHRLCYLCPVLVSRRLGDLDGDGDGDRDLAVARGSHLNPRRGSVIPDDQRTAL